MKSTLGAPGAQAGYTALRRSDDDAEPTYASVLAVLADHGPPMWRVAVALVGVRAACKTARDLLIAPAVIPPPRQPPDTLTADADLLAGVSHG